MALTSPAALCARAGQEGFAGNSTPLYMYSNPGAWASLLGVDFVRNNKAPGIDYATMHVYVDQWLCVTEGSTLDGQLEFMKCAASLLSALPHPCWPVRFQCYAVMARF